MKGSLRIPFQYHFAKKCIYFHTAFEETLDLPTLNKQNKTQQLISKKEKEELILKSSINLYNFILYKELWCLKDKSYITHLKILENNQLNQLFYFKHNNQVTSSLIFNSEINKILLIFSKEILKSQVKPRFDLKESLFQKEFSQVEAELRLFLNEYSLIKKEGIAFERREMFKYMKYFIEKVCDVEDLKYGKYEEILSGCGNSKDFQLRTYLFSFFIRPERFKTMIDQSEL